jgi:hypothetical protein
VVPDWVHLYRPVSIQPAQWEQIRSFVIDSVMAASPSLTVARKSAPHAVAFAAWAHREGALSLSDALADPDWVERYIAVGMPGAAESTRATRRAALRRIGRRLSGPEVPSPAAMRYRTLKPPYQAWESARYLDLCRLQPTAARRRSLAAVLTLGLGAGLDGRDMAWVQGCGVRRDDGHLVVRVGGGSRPRQVVVLDRYAESVEQAAAGCGEQLVIGGSALGRHNVTSVALNRMITDRSLPSLVASRLRSTWLTTHLNLRTPLSVLLPAAGLVTARPLGDLLPYVDPIPTDAVAALLSGARD